MRTKYNWDQEQLIAHVFEFVMSVAGICLTAMSVLAVINYF